TELHFAPRAKPSLWEKVDWRAAPRRLRGVGRSAVVAKLEHPSSVAFGDTFSHKETFAQKPNGDSVVKVGAGRF
ncbi:hypothetical protein, partial [Mesorhizobium sp.]|uniref:hypothetical protein n=1 Tax=Mesorhizobium sp. TaxID=1871066 RepID=UPI0025FA86D0